MPKKTLLIFGAGGHGREVAWVAQRVFGSAIKIAFVVDQAKYWHHSVDGHSVFLYDDLIKDENFSYIAALGDPRDRKRASEKMDLICRAASLIDKDVLCSCRVSFSEGCVVMPQSVLTTNVKLGSHVHINIGCSISHDTKIDSFSTIAPGVKVAGNVSIGESVYVGIGATIINGSINKPLKLGSGSIIAAGATVIYDVPSNSLVAGVPAKVKKTLTV